MTPRRAVSTNLNQSNVLTYLIRVGVACLGIATLLFVVVPTTLNSFAEWFPLRQTLVNLIKGYPGFGPDWLSVASLITVSAYIYCYLAILLVAANILRPPKSMAFNGIDGKVKWRRFSNMVYARLDLKVPMLKNREYVSKHESLPEYSTSRDGVRSVVMDIFIVISFSFFGYTALQEAVSNGGIVVRILDAIMVFVWCYCMFSILMSFSVSFVVVAWSQCRHFFIKN